MLSNIYAITTLAMSLLAVATPAPLIARNEPASQCSTGPVQCCESTETVSHFF